MRVEIGIPLNRTMGHSLTSRKTRPVNQLLAGRDFPSELHPSGVCSEGYQLKTGREEQIPLAPKAYRFTSISFTTCWTLGTFCAVCSASLRCVGVFTLPFRVITPFFASKRMCCLSRP